MSLPPDKPVTIESPAREDTERDAELAMTTMRRETETLCRGGRRRDTLHMEPVKRVDITSRSYAVEKNERRKVPVTVTGRRAGGEANFLLRSQAFVRSVR